MQPSSSNPASHNGLTRAEATLPSAAYWDAGAYQQDLDAIWYRSWLLVCREAELAHPLDFRTFRVGTQEIVLLRDETGELRAFHNTCRHRGSQLCQVSEGRLKARLITCPYHAWSYSLRGDLVRVPSKSLPDGFDKADHPLYGVALSVWRGFVFINLQKDAAGSAQASFDPASGNLGSWPLEALVTGHALRKVMNCNWKVFWENFNECLHCPGVHKDLSRLVPIYGRGLMSRHDDPEWTLHADNDAPEFSGGLRAGAETWSRDGRTHGPVFAGLTPAEHAAGQTYVTSLPSMFIVGHVDYVRTVRLAPLGPEQTELTAEWLFAPEALAATDIDNIVGFGTQVLEEDAAICEVNQKGLRSMRHKAGVLMPEEYDLHRFHDWVRERHAALAP
ncbi:MULTISPECIES: aromatic ring-hydroxylating dioxygenase subunit alpha [unclassified Mesorhizobium]|uniref:aromatic ring-hydroxylating oxygenase subunit alpha n=1 Tax=unclassified Mesorhizobium TaxID=325217 RepID=UPI00112E8419|nr:MULTISPECIES: aromatic ring-hydroxylating dioxygenase subunit alpha [unclassified Mesorhizobium]MBZ9895321.1 aromatic ring-hydroxylating dioxygenase subunit alpha [Mesorhizobium sp. BR1-1-6]TPJ62276.1 aromatic ring-hydroxylating dioxygenase subunit alpha [Mesorhizobium sp. B2-6-1]TPN42250.1 aromatic ring-hydroxylating dioxygenase subunit alpha [Mesorhizobium sp. B1-1-6]TPN59490.1 aromatic ring-hydroxylating dioxygenase subunit alpha [Mesorhizobium sp. B1-1-4]